MQRKCSNIGLRCHARNNVHNDRRRIDWSRIPKQGVGTGLRHATRVDRDVPSLMVTQLSQVRCYNQSKRTYLLVIYPTMTYLVGVAHRTGLYRRNKCRRIIKQLTHVRRHRSQYFDGAVY